mmetsp:Transcript_46309/g.115213  ORF Transcript_46309/g.115213 Transcript_46309/m.115213 type:complete len:203 (-) Transcript_46309:766-1374(-)
MSWRRSSGNSSRSHTKLPHLSPSSLPQQQLLLRRLAAHRHSPSRRRVPTRCASRRSHLPRPPTGRRTVVMRSARTFRSTRHRLTTDTLTSGGGCRRKKPSSPGETTRRRKVKRERRRQQLLPPHLASPSMWWRGRCPWRRTWCCPRSPVRTTHRASHRRVRDGASSGRRARYPSRFLKSCRLGRMLTTRPRAPAVMLYRPVT